MTDKELKRLTERHGAIVQLTEAEKTRFQQKGYTVQEIQTPCGANGLQAVSRPKRNTQ